MMFFFLILGIAGVGALLARLGVPGLATWPDRIRIGLAAGLMMAGVDHLLTPERYMAMIESFLPYAKEIVFITGVCEVAGALGVLWGETRRLAGICLAVYFVCVFPANINNAINGLQVDGLPQAAWYYWVRLLFQPLIIWFALLAGGVIRRPPKAL